MTGVRRWIATALAAVGLSAVIVPLVLVVGAGTALACSCVPTTEQEQYGWADAVFEGKLVDVEPPPQQPIMSSMDPATLTFEVSTVYKGDVDATQKVTTASGGGPSCGLELQGEGPYLVFTTADGDTLSANLCGGTRPVADGAPAFGPGSPPSGAPPAQDPAAGEPPATESTGTSSTGSSLPTAGLFAGAAALALVALPTTFWLRSRRFAAH